MSRRAVQRRDKYQGCHLYSEKKNHVKDKA